MTPKQHSPQTITTSATLTTKKNLHIKKKKKKLTMAGSVRYSF